MDNEKLVTWFTDVVVPDLLAKGCFAQDDEHPAVLDSCQFQNFEKNVVNFASSPSFLEVKLKTLDGIPCTRHLFVKFQIQDDVYREKMRTMAQFRNESVFYNKVVSEFRKFLSGIGPDSVRILQEITPKCYYAIQPEDKPEEGFVALEDVSRLGFKMSASKLEMDEDHCKLAVANLARFHAISLAMKFVKWPTFDNLKKSAETVWMADDSATREMCQDFKGFCARRGIDYLFEKEESQVPHFYLENLSRKFENMFDLLKEAFSPREPLAVVCHGDFNRNNLLFAYEEDRPVRVKLIDFQMFNYGSPCLDLSFFIYMNTTLEFREDHMDDLFRLYYSTLTKTIASLAKVSEDAIRAWIPFSAFLNEFERTCINAYVTAAFFLPVIMAPKSEAFDAMKTASNKEMAEQNYKQGGERVSQRIADIIVDFYKRRFFCQAHTE